MQTAGRLIDTPRPHPYSFHGMRLCALVLALSVLAGCQRTSSPGGAREDFVTVAHGRYVNRWERRFNPFDSDPLWPARAGIYEPLIIFNTMTAEYVPWLATEFRWSDGNRRLTFSTRPDVKWSDGRPFTARDVAFTFGLMRAHEGLDNGNVWEFLAGVRALDDAQVEFAFKRPYTPALTYVGHQPIVAEHAWKDVAHPVSHPDATPVGTGPFTVVRRFEPTVYEIGRNDRYWQRGKPHIGGVRLPAFTSNDQVVQSLLKGELDWIGTFIPDIQKVYLAADPEHRGFWFPPVGDTIMLYANTTRRPFQDVRVRKAISMALDRERIARTAMHGYTHPSDGTGLSPAHSRWKDIEAARLGSWVQRDVAAANRLLDEAGLRRQQGRRRGADGRPLRYEINVVRGWTDWESVAKIAAENLSELGIEASPAPMDFAAWMDGLRRGAFDLSIGWSVTGPTPYHFYRGQMGSDTVRPVGEPASANWHRFSHPAADAALREFEASSTRAELQRLATRLQTLFAEHAPALPLFPGPAWGEFNTTRFTGFPSAERPYARLAPAQDPERLLVLLELRPR